MRGIILSAVFILTAPTILGFFPHAYATARKPASQPLPGYRCALKEDGDFGQFNADITVDLDGKSSGYLGWDARDGRFQDPWLTAAWFVDGSNRFTKERGYISIMRHLHTRGRGTGPGVQKLKLAITTTTDGFPTGAVRLESNLQRSAGPFYISADWNDVSAMARGADKLWLIAKDKKGKVVDSVQLDRDGIQLAYRKLPDVIERLNGMLARPSERCTYIENLRGEEIIVT